MESFIVLFCVCKDYTTEPEISHPTCRIVLQPSSYLAQPRLVRWHLWLLHGSFYVPEPRINPHMAMAGKSGGGGGGFFGNLVVIDSVLQHLLCAFAIGSVTVCARERLHGRPVTFIHFDR